MSDEDSRASTNSSSSSSSSHQQQQQEANPPKKRDSRASMSKTSKHLSTSAKRWVQWVEWESSTGACDVTQDKLAGGKFVVVFAEQLRFWLSSFLFAVTFYWLRSDFAEFRRNWLTSHWTLHQTAGESFVTPGSLTSVLSSRLQTLWSVKLVFQCTEFFITFMSTSVCERGINIRCLWLTNDWWARPNQICLICGCWARKTNF